MSKEKCSDNCGCSSKDENDILGFNSNSDEEVINEGEVLKKCCEVKNDNIASLKNEVDELQDKFLRLSAEYDNYRKRSQKEKEELYGSACVDIMSEILPILDNLDRANSAQGDIESLKQGIDMVIKLFESTLEKLGVKEIDSSVEFDPNLHNAVMHVEDESLGKNIIVEVLQKGYMKNGKVIRHSMVKVAN